MREDNVLIADYIKGSLEHYISAAMMENELSKEEALKTIVAPAIATLLKEHGAQVLTERDLDIIIETVETLKVDKTVKQIMKDFTKQIRNIMKGET
tara:strand:- start:5941 stop:6228 length:288 start_codon:yes stop_codon:yes gene_type:complete